MNPHGPHAPRQFQAGSKEEADAWVEALGAAVADAGNKSTHNANATEEAMKECSNGLKMGDSEEKGEENGSLDESGFGSGVSLAPPPALGHRRQRSATICEAEMETARYMVFSEGMKQMN